MRLNRTPSTLMQVSKMSELQKNDYIYIKQENGFREYLLVQDDFLRSLGNRIFEIVMVDTITGLDEIMKINELADSFIYKATSYHPKS
jgi:hypothetical protein